MLRLLVSVAILAPLLLAAPEMPGKKVAVVVGVNTYDGLTNLAYAVNDAVELGKVLRSPACRFDEVTLIISDGPLKPTAANVRAALEKTLRGRKRADTVLVALAGHGIQAEVRDPKGDGEPRKYPFFCTSDADTGTVKYATGHSETMLNLDHLFEDVGRCNAGVKLVLMDACRNELKATGRTRSLAETKVSVPDGVQALFSCGRKQVAHELEDLKHGLFFFHVIEGLKGKAKDDEGAVTWASLTGYATRNVARDARMRLKVEQSPTATGYYEGETPVLVAAGLGVVVPERPKAAVAKTFKNVAGMTMVRIPGTKEQFPKKGTFTMGSPKSEKDRGNDENQHEVEVSEFYLGAHEVTVGQWRAFVKDTSYETEAEKSGEKLTWKAPGIEQGEDHPVVLVSWNDAKAYLAWLTKQADDKRPSGWVYRLPREAEWEFACRAGASSYSTFTFGDVLDDSDSQVNFNGIYPHGSEKKSTNLKTTKPVGSYKANGLGLFDMHGNAFEWCADWFDPDYFDKSDGAKDPVGPSDASDRVIRGGCWHSFAMMCRSAHRAYSRPTYRHHGIGFRVALVPALRGKME